MRTSTTGANRLDFSRGRALRAAAWVLALGASLGGCNSCKKGDDSSDGAGAAASSSASAGAVAKASVAPTTGSACFTSCAKDKSDGAESYCGTDGKTYAACSWICDETPAGVGVYPDACAADGKPAPGGPSEAADGASICDWFKNGDEWEAVECEEATDDETPAEADLFGKGAAGGTDLDAAETELPDEVSHRARFGSIKDQRSAPSCISFASTAALEGAITAETNQRVVLSEMHFLSHYRTTKFGDAIKALQVGSVLDADATQAGFGYDAGRAARWLKAKEEPSSDDVKALDAKIAFEVVSVVKLLPKGGGKRVTATQLAEAIADGNDLMVGFRMSDNWYTANLLPGGVIEDYDEGRNFGHAVLLVGYKKIDGKGYFEIRNSWGPQWGDHGYGFISFETAEQNLQVAAMVGVRRHSTLPAQECADGQGAGLDGACKKLCPDGTLADDEGVCHGEGAECKAGRVKDPSNMCVRACAPGAREIDDLKVDCKKRGCTWKIPAGAHGCKAKEGRVCVVTCPAPSCELVESKNEFGVPVLGCSAD